MAAVVVVYVDEQGRVVRLEERDKVTFVQAGGVSYRVGDVVKKIAARSPAGVPVGGPLQRAYLLGKVRGSPHLTEEQKEEALRIIQGVTFTTVVVFRQATPDMFTTPTGGVPNTVAKLIVRYVDP